MVIHGIMIYLINRINRQSAFVSRDRTVYSRIGSKSIYYFHIGRLGTYALHDASLVSDFNI